MKKGSKDKKMLSEKEFEKHEKAVKLYREKKKKAKKK